ncbi:MAG TPA: UDP-3-O-[3-hydroxymyristoyl] N-acetylglucosamine deacetylase, partial [candidate division Zixibacteria bacterium]|nr:UDP-3-O-[3-hydroxymyristoyl] N-acetylglucosamine deacetylase [candidate division Zixibacteria bacterium]
MKKQRTIAKPVELEGVGLHTGEKSRVRFLPAPENTWYVFRRVDIDGKPEIEALVENAKDELVRGTVLEKNGVEVSTVEHLLAALYGMEIDNCIVELEGPEPPVLDGSAKPFADAILEAGITEQDAPREYLVIDEVIQFSQPERKTDIHIIPFDGFRITLMVDYANPALGTQYTTLESL